jgi:hypothetical protein
VSCLQDVGEDEIPLRPDMSGSLNGLNTALSISIDLVQLLVVAAAARHAGAPRSAQLLVWAASVHARVALDGSRDVGDILVVSLVVTTSRDQRIGGQSLEREPHLVCRMVKSTLCDEREGRLMEEID